MRDAASHPGPTIAERFARIASVYPEAVALCAAEGRTTYGQLEGRSNQFARFLRHQGVVAGDRVALIIGRSEAAIVAILGILKCGAVYVPLDEHEPEARLGRMLADSNPALVLTGPQVRVAPDWLSFRLDTALAESAGLPSDAVLTGAARSDPVCVMYTSGSTGQPKGVVVPHGAILRLVHNQTYAPFGPDAVFLHFAPLAFDASSFEIWGALLHGGTLVIIEHDRTSLDALAAAIGDHGVTVAWFTAGLFTLLVDHCLPGLAPLRCIVAGGDVLSATHVVRAYAALPDCTIVNGYGPTENTTFTCCYPVPRHGLVPDTLPIGFPIAGTEVLILGPDLQPVADGEAGEICCAGEGLACGYLNQPAQTAEKFVRVQIGGRPPERVYLTGDLGRRRIDGAFMFLGRMDQQIKIRGKRVELGEVEHALRQDDAVLDAVVTAGNAQSDGRRLTAHVVLRGHDMATADASRGVLERLSLRLPDYMVPVQIRVLDRLPLTKSGKVDRALLRDLAQVATPPKPEPLRASDSLEDRVAAIWGDVLRVTPLDRAANFFDLGGNSLLLMELHARLRSALAPNLPLMRLFEHTSIRALAAFLSQSPSPSDLVAGRSRAGGVTRVRSSQPVGTSG